MQSDLESDISYLACGAFKVLCMCLELCHCSDVFFIRLGEDPIVFKLVRLTRFLKSYSIPPRFIRALKYVLCLDLKEV